MSRIYLLRALVMGLFVCGNGAWAGAAEIASQSWPSFQNAGHTSVDAPHLPVEWSADKNIAWRAEIEGYGQSTPVVSGQQIVVTSVSGDQKENYHLAAFAVDSGEKLWQQNFKNPTPQENTNYVSRAAPTPAADDAGYIAFFEGGLVVALDRNGQARWQRDLIADYGPITSRHGLSSSVEQNARHVFVWVEREKEPYIVALDKSTGETAWKSPGLGATSWSSPRLVPTADGDHLVLSASGKLAGLDPATGEKWWEFDKISNNTTCTPMPVGEGKFVIGASDGRGEDSAGKGAASNGLVQITKQDDGKFAADFVWNAKTASSSFGSPIIAGDTVCIVNRSGVLFLLELATGKQTGTTRVASGSIWATPIVAGDRLYLFGQKGTTSIVSLASGDETAKNSLWETGDEAPAAEGRAPAAGVLYAAAVAPPYLMLRSGNVLYAIRSPQAAE